MEGTRQSSRDCALRLSKKEGRRKRHAARIALNLVAVHHISPVGQRLLALVTAMTMIMTMRALSAAATLLRRAIPPP